MGRKIGGGTADATCFSFYATKNLTTGEGGMVTTNRADWADRIRVASLHGLSRDAWTRYAADGRPHYDVLEPGFKYNMPDIQAAIGLHQLAALERHLERRAGIWRRYDDGLEGLPVTRPAPIRAGDRHARHLYTVLVDGDACGLSRDALQQALQARGIVTSIHFTAVHLHTYYRTRFGFARGRYPVAETISDRTLSLPLSAAMTDDDVTRVIEAVHGSLS
jgi:dTDP-4-amino-4,6-dideoxygalactose transaminase